MIYELAAITILEELVALEPGTFADISAECGFSFFEKLPKTPLSVTASECGGALFSDYYYCDNVPLFSERAYKMIAGELQKNVFIRDVEIYSPLARKSAGYKMVLPQRIDCIDKARSVLRPIIPGIPDMPLRAEVLVISEKMLGNTSIFKVRGISDNNIYVRENIRNILDTPELNGIELLPLGE